VWSIVVTVNEQNDIQAFKITVGTKALFLTVKADKRSRIQDTAISAQAMLPGGPYDLWREDEPSRRVKDLVGAFAENPKLPKMLALSPSKRGRDEVHRIASGRNGRSAGRFGRGADS
jgi:hypothetical protein